MDEISKFQVEKKNVSKNQIKMKPINAKNEQLNESRFFCTRVLIC